MIKFPSNPKINQPFTLDDRTWYWNGIGWVLQNVWNVDLTNTSSNSLKNINTGSFATTGSNIFKGNQTITGSLNVTGSVNVNGITKTKNLTIYSGSISASLSLDSNGNLFVDKTLYSTEGISAYGLGITGSGGGSGSGLITNVYNTSSLGNSFNNSTLTDTFNAYTIKYINDRVTTLSNTIGNNGSYATTGSNIFKGNQTISGSLNVTGSSKLNGLTLTNGTNDVQLLVDSNGLLRVNKTLYSLEGISAYGLGVTGGGGSGSGLITNVYNTSNLNDSFNNSTLTDTFNAYTTQQIYNNVNLLSSKTGSYATTGSNNFTGIQKISGSLNVTGSVNITGSAYINNEKIASNEYVQSRGTNLITNGNGFLNNNYNFSSFTFDNSDTYVGKGSFKTGTGSWIEIKTDEFIPVNINKTYQQSLYLKSGNINGTNYVSDNKNYIGVAQYDIDFNLVQTQHSCKYSGSTDTYLTRTLYNGDSYMYVNNATGWAQTTNKFTNHFCWYGYTNSKGYVYPDYSYTRYNSGNYVDPINGMWNTSSISDIGGGEWRINLNTTWGGPTLYSNTNVRNTFHGSTFGYTFLNISIPNSWVNKTGVMNPSPLDGVHIGENNFRKGTEFAKIVLITNCNPPTDINNIIKLSDVKFHELDYTLRTDYVPKWDGSNFTSSLIKSSGSIVSVEGNLYATGEVTAFQASDARLKEDIKPLINSLDIINNLNPVSFKWNETAKELNSNKSDDINYGLIAQELETVLPDLVHIYNQKYKSVDYIQLIPILINAVKELSEQIKNK